MRSRCHVYRQAFFPSVVSSVAPRRPTQRPKRACPMLAPTALGSASAPQSHLPVPSRARRHSVHRPVEQTVRQGPPAGDRLFDRGLRERQSVQEAG